MFVVHRITGSPGGSNFEHIYDGLDSVKRQGTMWHTLSTKWWIVGVGEDVSGPEAIPHPWMVSCFIYNGANSYWYRDGVLRWGPGSWGANAISGLSIGAAYNDTSFLSGDIAEFMLYNAAVPTATRKLIEAYLGTEYGIAVAP